MDRGPCFGRDWCGPLGVGAYGVSLASGAWYDLEPMGVALQGAAWMEWERHAQTMYVVVAG